MKKIIVEMKPYFLLLFLGFLSIQFTACTSHQKITNSSTVKIISTAKTYLGTPYKWAGTTRKGMDCSGLVYTSFLKNNIQLPRVSREQSKTGKTISIKKVIPGDLLFFKTDGSWKINHSAIVTEVNSNDIKFIHATNSRGVIISSMHEKYWKNAFNHAQRVLNNSVSITKVKYHKVASGETLYGISKQYKTTVEHLKKMNHLQSNTIKIGVVLRIF